MDKPTVLMMGPYPAWDMERLEADYDIIRLWEADDAQALLAAHGGKVRAIATRGELTVSKEVIARLPALQLIACYGVGTDGIDRSATRPRGIRITNTPDVLTEDVADLAIALMLAATRQIVRGDRFVRDGSWARGSFELVTRLNGKRLGIIGLGRIGKAIARRAEAFAMPVAYFGRRRQEGVVFPYYRRLEELAAASDVLVAILPGGPETAKIVNAAVFAALGPEGYFINVARGSVVDEPALIQALEHRIIKGAALDVFWNEPLIDQRFAALDNVVLHPHNGSATVETRRAMGQLMRDNLTAFFAGRALLTEVA